MRIASGMVEDQVRPVAPDQTRQMLFEEVQVFLVPQLFIHGNVKIALLLLKGKVDTAVHGKGEDFWFLTVNPGSSVSLVHI